MSRVNQYSGCDWRNTKRIPPLWAIPSEITDNIGDRRYCKYRWYHRYWFITDITENHRYYHRYQWKSPILPLLLSVISPILNIGDITDKYRCFSEGMVGFSVLFFYFLTYMEKVRFFEISALRAAKKTLPKKSCPSGGKKKHHKNFQPFGRIKYYNV